MIYVKLLESSASNLTRPSKDLCMEALPCRCVPFANITLDGWVIVSRKSGFAALRSDSVCSLRKYSSLALCMHQSWPSFYLLPPYSYYYGTLFKQYYNQGATPSRNIPCDPSANRSTVAGMDPRVT